MSLEITLQNSTGDVFSLITSDAKTVEIEDRTGDYNASTNTTGYGTPNESRADVGLKLFVVRKPSTGNEVMTVTNYDDDDPGAVTKFRFTNTAGGRYNMLFAAIQDYDVGETYQDGELAYDTSAEKFYESLVGSNIGNALTSTSHWRDLSTLAEKDLWEIFKTAKELTSTHQYFEDVDKMLMSNGIIKTNRKILNAACMCTDFCEFGPHNEHRTIANAVLIKAADGNFTEAQEAYEDLMNLP